MNPRITNCFKGTFFGVLSFFAIGVFTIILGWILNLLYKIKIQESGSKMHVYVIIAVSFSAIFWIISTIAPCFNNKKLRMATSILLVFYLVLNILGIVAVRYFTGKIDNNFAVLWPEDADPDKVRYEVLDQPCCGWSNNETYCQGKDYEHSCREVLNGKISEYARYVNIVFIIISVINALGIIGAFFISCKTQSESEDGVKSREAFNTPLTYGW